MVEIIRFFSLSPHHGIDNLLQLHYGDKLEKRLLPGKPITDANLVIGVVGNGTIRPENFQLREDDSLPIKITIPETGDCFDIAAPGKSGIIILDPDNFDKRDLKELVNVEIDGAYDRRDHLHTATVGEIADAGWSVLWAPLQMQKK